MAIREIMELPVVGVLHLIRDSRSTRGQQRLVLDAIALRLDAEQGNLFWCGDIPLLAGDTELDKRDVRRAIQKLGERYLLLRATLGPSTNYYSINTELL
jgi:hypothetical protein